MFQLAEYLPCKQYVVGSNLNLNSSFFIFHGKSVQVRFIALLGLCRSNGRLQSLDCTHWTGLVDWTGGL